MIQNETNLQKIRKLLSKQEVQLRIQKNIERAQNEARVTIGRAADIFKFSESKLREWDRSGLLKVMRSATEKTGQRQYSLTELRKLAIIRELVNEGCVATEIPLDVEELWYNVVREGEQREIAAHAEGAQEQRLASKEEYQPITKRIENAYREELFWRYYTSRILLSAFMLMYEHVPNTTAGLVLPVGYDALDFVPDSYNISEIGTALVGWLGQTSSFYTFLTPKPFFEFPTDFSIEPLRISYNGERQRGDLADRTFIVVQRDERKSLNLDRDTVRIVQRLLAPIYENVDHWQHYFGEGMQDMVMPGIDFAPNLPDALLTGFADVVIRLGGRQREQDRWQFCCILLPDSPSLPLQQRNLIVRAQSKNAPKDAKGLKLSPGEKTSLSLRAFQSGHSKYRPMLSRDDTTVVISELEGPVLSNIALPIGGEDGQPIGILYVASYIAEAFSLEDQRVLRVITRVIEELLASYSARKKLTENLKEAVKKPEVVDSLFEDFLSENDFLIDLEQILMEIKTSARQENYSGEGDDVKEIRDSQPQANITHVSFIAIDIDNQEEVANKYGDQIVRHLNKEVGVRIKEFLPAFFSRYSDCKLYHIYADRFYLLLRDFAREEAIEKARRLRRALEGNISIKLSTTQRGGVILPGITVHQAVTSYSHEKLREILNLPQYPSTYDAVTMIAETLDITLKKGADTVGGNVIYAWNPRGIYDLIDD